MRGRWRESESVGACGEGVIVRGEREGVRELDGCGGCKESYGALLGM